MTGKKGGRKKLGEYVELPEALQKLVDVGLVAAAAENKVELGDLPLKFKVNVHRRGKYAKDVQGTRARYDTQCRQLWAFLALRGAYDSMLMLLFPKKTENSTNCPAMDLSELCAFVRCKMNPKGMALRSGNQDDCPVPHDVFGQPMTCIGDWKAKKTMDMFGTSVSSVHKVHGHDSSYFDTCEACKATEETRKNGCARHNSTRKSLAFRQGNPVLTRDFVTNKQTLKDPNYQARASTQIDPGDVRSLRRALLGGLPTLPGLKFCTMVIIAIKLFLRADELVTLKVESFPPTLFFRVGEIINSMGVSITGKTDQQILRWYLLFADDKFPDVCPVRHLLIHLCLAKITSGWLFPCDADLMSEQEGASGVCMDHEHCATLLNSMKKLADRGVFEYSDKAVKKKEFRCTIHSFRKAAYCFRIVASPANQTIDWASLRCDARHVEEADMFICVRDAATLKQTIDFSKTPEMKVTDNRKVRFETLCAAEKQCSKTSNAINLTLPELARQHALSLGCGPSASLRELLTKALQPRMTPVDQKRAFEATLSHSQLVAFGNLYDGWVMNRNYPLENQARAITNQQAAASSSTTTATSTRKKGKGNNGLLLNDLEERNSIKKLKTVKEKMEAFLKLEEVLPKDKELTSGAKKWVYVSLKPALRCLREHHNGNLDQCALAWGKKWKMKSPCNGHGGASGCQCFS